MQEPCCQELDLHWSSLVDSIFFLSLFLVAIQIINLIIIPFPKGTAAGPSGLRVQHLLDVASIPLPGMTICSLLRRVVNLLVSGKVPQEVYRFMAGGSLTALSKLKPGCAPDIRPIAVGEVLRRLTGKCLCAVIKQRFYLLIFLSLYSLVWLALWVQKRSFMELEPVWKSFGMTGIFQL